MKRTLIYDSLMVVLVLGLLLSLKIPYVSIVLSFTLVLIYAHRRGGIAPELGFTKPESFVQTILMAAGLSFVIVLIAYFGLLPLIEGITEEPLRLGMFEQLRENTGLLVISLLIGWIIGGLMEETIFRAFLISRLINHLSLRIGGIIGAILTSIIFGYLHSYQGMSGQVLTGCIGLILAAIYILNKQNIWLNIFTHGFINTFSMLVLYFDLVSLG